MGKTAALNRGKSSANLGDITIPDTPETAQAAAANSPPVNFLGKGMPAVVPPSPERDGQDHPFLDSAPSGNESFPATLPAPSTPNPRAAESKSPPALEGPVGVPAENPTPTEPALSDDEPLVGADAAVAIGDEPSESVMKRPAAAKPAAKKSAPKPPPKSSTPSKASSAAPKSKAKATAAAPKASFALPKVPGAAPKKAAAAKAAKPKKPTAKPKEGAEPKAKSKSRRVQFAELTQENPGQISPILLQAKHKTMVRSS